MPDPKITKKMRLIIDSTTVDVVELVNLEVFHEGNVESKYGQTDNGSQYIPWNRHKIGIQKVRFTIRRWFKAGNADTDLLYDLHNADTEFTLIEYLNDVYGEFAGLQINNCISYGYSADTGTANDIIIEEIRGEGLTYETYITNPCVPNQIHNGDFETGLLAPEWDCPLGGVEVIIINPHGGTYCAQLHGSGGHQIRQTINPNIAVNDIVSFTIWYRQTVASCTITIFYTDTTTTVIGPGDLSGNWVQYDVLAGLTAGKTINEIEFSVTQAGDWFLDDVVMDILC